MAVYRAESKSKMVMKVPLSQRERRNRKSLSLIRQATVINGGAGGEHSFFRILWKYEEAPNNRFHSDRAGRGVYSLFCADRNL
jgi:hypothetical protein